VNSGRSLFEKHSEEIFHLKRNLDGLVKSVNRPGAGKPRPGVRVEPFEFTSNGGGRGSPSPPRKKA